MHKYLVIAAFLFLLNCSSLSNNEDVAKRALPYPVQMFDFKLGNGEMRHAFHYSSGDKSGSDGVMVFLQGSGCSSFHYLGLMLANIQGNYNVYALEKAGVIYKATYNDECAPEFYAKHIPSSYVNEVARFATAQFNKNKTAKIRVIWGSSEGGALSGMVVPLVPLTTHTIISSAGGGTGEDFIRARGEMLLGAASKAITDQAIYDIRNSTTPSIQYPNSDYSYGYAKERLNAFHLEGLRKIKAKTLVAHGGKDVFAPVSLARLACKELEHSVSKPSYFFQTDGDHFHKTPETQNNKVFFEAMHNWIKGQSHPLISVECPY